MFRLMPDQLCRVQFRRKNFNTARLNTSGFSQCDACPASGTISMTRRGHEHDHLDQLQLPQPDRGQWHRELGFLYGPDRQRWRTQYVNGATTETTYHIGKEFQKVITTSTDYRHYIYAGNRSVAVYSRKSTGTNTLRYVLEDHQGSVANILASNGTSYVKENFSAFGNRRNPTTWSGAPSSGDLNLINGVTREGYTWQTALGNMGLNHMNGRVQDAITGRFISPDPNIPNPMRTQDYNRYSYVYSNPMTHRDPSGFAIGYHASGCGYSLYEDVSDEDFGPRAPSDFSNCFFELQDPFMAWFLTQARSLCANGGFVAIGAYAICNDLEPTRPPLANDKCPSGLTCLVDVNQNDIGQGRGALARVGNTISGSFQVVCHDRPDLGKACDEEIARLNGAWNNVSSGGYSINIEFHSQTIFEELFAGTENLVNIHFSPLVVDGAYGVTQGRTLTAYADALPNTISHEAGHLFGMYDVSEAGFFMGPGKLNGPSQLTPREIEFFVSSFPPQ